MSASEETLVITRRRKVFPWAGIARRAMHDRRLSVQQRRALKELRVSDWVCFESCVPFAPGYSTEIKGWLSAPQGYGLPVLVHFTLDKPTDYFYQQGVLHIVLPVQHAHQGDLIDALEFWYENQFRRDPLHWSRRYNRMPHLQLVWDAA